MHCIVPGGGLSPDHQHWIACRPDFFLPVRVLSRRFRRLFLEGLEHAFQAGRLAFFSDLEPLYGPKAFADYLAPLRDTEWVVYAKRPFGGPKQVLDYLGRYTHRVAISNQHLVSAEEDRVAFRWKDYRHQQRQKTMTLQTDEFIRRFLLHTLPSGLQRIRHYGFLGNRHRAENLIRCRQLLGMPPPPPTMDSEERLDYRTFFEKLTSRSLLECPQCHAGRMVVLSTLPRLTCSPKFIDTS